VLFWYKGRVFSGTVDPQDPGYKNWGNPKKSKDMEIILQGRYPKRGVNRYGDDTERTVTVQRNKDAPRECLHEDVLFECFPNHNNMDTEEYTKYCALSFKQKQRKWIQMHPGRVHSWKTFLIVEESKIED